MKNSTDPAILEKSFDEQIDSAPLNVDDGQTFHNRKLKRTSGLILEIIPTTKALVIYHYLRLFGILFTVGTLIFGEHKLYALGGIILTVIGQIMLAGESIPTVFNKRTGQLTRKARMPYNKVEPENQDICLPLKNILALQVLGEEVSMPTQSGRHFYTSYELNLIFRDTSRLNVMDHADKKRLISDAKAIGRFLNIPILDQTTNISTSVNH